MERRDMTPEETKKSVSMFEELLGQLQNINTLNAYKPNREQRRRGIVGKTIKKGPKRVYRPAQPTNADLA